MTRLGIFGGTFNPIHHCHLHIANKAMSRMKLDRVIFVPSGHPPHKPPGAVLDPEARLAMVRLAIAGEPRFSVSDQEVNRAGKSYAVETVATFRRQYPGADIFFILGIDAFLEIGHWRAADRLLTICHFVVVSRYGFTFEQLEKLALSVKLDRSTLVALDQGRKRKVTIPMEGGVSLFLLKIPPCKASSTEIRKRLKAREDMKNFLPEAVKSYILEHELYREGIK